MPTTIALLPALMFAVAHSNFPGCKSIKPAAIELQASAMVDGAQFTGVVELGSSFVIASQLDATLAGVDVAVGDQVRKGDTLARLESRDLTAEHQLADVALRAAMAKLTVAQESSQSARQMLDIRTQNPTLFAKTEIAEMTAKFAELQAQIYVARSDVASAQIQVREARERQRALNVLAVQDGYLVAQYIQKGEHVSAGNALFKIQLDDTAKIRFLVPGNRFESRPKLEAQVCVYDELSANVRHAHVVDVSLGVDPALGGYIATAKIDGDIPLNWLNESLVWVMPHVISTATNENPSDVR